MLLVLKDEQDLVISEATRQTKPFTCNHSIGGCHCRDYMLDNTLIEQQKQQQQN